MDLESAKSYKSLGDFFAGLSHVFFPSDPWNSIYGVIFPWDPSPPSPLRYGGSPKAGGVPLVSFSHLSVRLKPHNAMAPQLQPVALAKVHSVSVISLANTLDGRREWGEAKGENEPLDCGREITICELEPFSRHSY